MANGINYDKEFTNIPSEQGAIGEMGGRVKCMFDSVAAAANGEVITMAKIPAGARIVRVSYAPLTIADDAAFSVAAGDKLLVETDATITAPSDQAGAELKCFIEYLLD